MKKARAKRKEFRASTERELQRVAPELVKGRNSVYFIILDGRVHNAAEVILSASYGAGCRQYTKLIQGGLGKPSLWNGYA